ncbi:hypothetical protein M3Y97_00647100 [Aphelenchoides bicaudatus]|nr:hypothetical protein M3Y97_00647100 [Aphelenchoides bicaudatus]
MPYEYHKVYVLPLFRKSDEQKKRAKKLVRMLIFLYLLLFAALLIFANASRQLGPWTACREVEDQYCLKTALVWSVVCFLMLFVFVCAGLSIFTVDQTLKCGCFDNGHILRATAALLVLSFITVIVFFSYGSFQLGRDFAQLFFGKPT